MHVPAQLRSTRTMKRYPAGEAGAAAIDEFAAAGAIPQMGFD